MKRYMAHFVCCVLLLAGWSAPKANAQAAAAQTHVAAAKALAYEPGQDLTNIFGICAEPRPGAAQAAEPAAAPAARRIPSRNQWYTEPAKVFDNAVQFRKPGGPHPFVNEAAVSRGQTIIYECMQAQLAWRAAK